MEKIKIVPLGGVGEIGMNCMFMEWNNTIIIIDCGVMFPEEQTFGIDFIIPDFSYLIKNKEKVKALIITHGHEDHIAAIPFLLEEMPLNIFATRFSTELIKSKLEGYPHRKHPITFTIIDEASSLAFDPVTIHFNRVRHSIVDGVAIIIDTPLGKIIHTGDFKEDTEKIKGKKYPLSSFEKYLTRHEKKLILLSDSTNSTRPGHSLSEKDVAKKLEDIFIHAHGRIIISLFASNISRIKNILVLAKKFNRKVFLDGKSIIKNVRIAKKLGFIVSHSSRFITSGEELKRTPDKETLVLSTGSQGEPRSSLRRMATGDHKYLSTRETDTIVLSSKFIPGNERAIYNIINHLYRQGAHVIYEKISEVHGSGHANQEELKKLISIVKPTHFVPIHGEYRHLRMHKELAESVEHPPQGIILISDGDILEITENEVKKNGRVPSGRIIVEGDKTEDYGSMVLRDRRQLSSTGIVVCTLIAHSQTGELISEPEIYFKGLFLKNEVEKVLKESKKLVEDTFFNATMETKRSRLEIQEEIRMNLRRFFKKKFDKKPLVVPIVLEV